MRGLYWLPVLGTGVMLVFGYCLMARMLSLLPWNRTEPLTLSLLRRTFVSPPALSRPEMLIALGDNLSVCELEARVASWRPTPAPC